MKIILNGSEIKEFLTDLLPTILPECGIKIDIKDIEFIVKENKFIGVEVELEDLFDPPENGVDEQNMD